jgi:uncharacterized protein DUF927/Cch-like protein
MTSNLTPGPKPVPIEPQFERIPEELRARPQWITWRYVPDGKKWTKVPFDPETGAPAKSNAPETWRSFECAVDAYQQLYDEPRPYDGVGYVFAEDDPYCGADLDDCFSEGGQGFSVEACRWIEAFDSYTEFSVSGAGLHIIMKAKPSRNFKNDKAGREMYDKTRYFIFTGASYHEDPLPIAERQEEAEAFIKEYAPRRDSPRGLAARPPSPVGGQFRTWDELRAELGRRIAAHETAHTNPKGNIDCRGICHDGEGTTALYYSPSKNTATCTKGCDQATILRAFGLPDEPNFGRAHSPTNGGPPAGNESRPAGSPPPSPPPDASEAPAQNGQDEEIEKARKIVAELSGKISVDSKAAFDPQVLGALATLRAQAPADFHEAKEILRGAKVSLRDIEREIKKYQPKLRLVKPDEDLTQYASDFLDDAPIADLIIPDGYKLEADRTLGQVPNPLGFPIMEPIAYGALLITGRTKDVDGEAEGIRLSWKRGDSWRHKIIDRGIVANARELVSLANTGFPVTSSDAKLQVEYFAKLEAANFSDLPTARTTSRMGWQGSDCKSGFSIGRDFVRPGGEIVEAEIRADSMNWTNKAIAFRGDDAGDDQVVEGYRADGDLDAWIEAVEKIAPYARVVSTVYASLASPLLQLLNLPNFILDLSARTSQGKTTAQRAAASVWGVPDERKPGAAIQTWDISKVGAERASAVLNGIPLILDDTKRAKNPQIIAETLYLVASGRGRVRGSLKGLQISKTWHTVLISSGEQPVTSFTNDGGTRMRTLEIEGAPFGRQDAETGKIVELFNLAILSNYGHAGRRFVAWLAENLDQRDEWKQEIGRRAEEYVRQAASERAGRLALYAATIAQAASLAHKALDLPWVFEDPIRKLWAEISGEAEDAVGARRALRYLLSWAWANEARFIGRELENNRGIPIAPPAGWIGRWDREEDFEFIGFYPHHVEDLLRAQKFNPDAVMSEWRERGWLRVKDDGQRRFTCEHRLRGEVKRAHLVTVLRKGIDEIDA